MNRTVTGFFKFIGSGAFNTAAAYGLYLVLLQFLSYRWSYTVSYASGIVLAYVLYRYLVFGRTGRRYGPLWVCLIYLGQYFAGLALTVFWVEILGEAAVWAPAFSITILIPSSYFLNRWVFSWRAPAEISERRIIQK